MTGALAAFYRHTPVAHVEAGLRTGNMEQPFPGEMNRRVTSRLAALHFAPTEGARRNLLAEGIPETHIAVTGNSGIDALLYVSAALEQGGLPPRHWPWLDPAKRLIVVTAHRRESFGGGIQRICDSLTALARRCDVQLVYPCAAILTCSTRSRKIWPPTRHRIDRTVGLRLLRRPDARGPAPDHRFRRHPGRGSLAGKAGPGHAGMYRAAGSRRRRNRQTGGHRSAPHYRRSVAPARQRRGVRAYVAHPQSLRRRQHQRAYYRGNSALSCIKTWSAQTRCNGRPDPAAVFRPIIGHGPMIKPLIINKPAKDSANHRAAAPW